MANRTRAPPLHGCAARMWLPILAVLVAPARGSSAPSASPGRPNIILVLADDFGWANLGVHRKPGGSRQAALETQTPNLDRLIEEGVLLDRHYAYKICSPSRSSLQSGRLAVHVNAVNKGVTVHNESDPVSGYAGIPRNMTGLATKLKAAGYATHAVGKWDAGMATPEHTPLGRGYDSWLGYFQHANDYWRKTTPLQSTGELDNCLNSFTDFFAQNSTYFGGAYDNPSMTPRCLADPTSDIACYEEEAFKARALKVVEEHDTRLPLFLFYSFHLLHTPLQVPDSYLEAVDKLVRDGGGMDIDSAGRRLYSAMAMYMDEAVGQLVEALRKKGIWENTVFVFTSDNGGPVYLPGSANNHPLRGGKYSDFEGGVRVNAFVSGGLVPTGRRNTTFTGVVSIADWYPTFCELAGVDAVDHAAMKANVWLKDRGLPLLPPVDGVSQWVNILNGTEGDARKSLHLSEQALLRWPYKLVLGRQVYSGWQGELFPNCSTIDQALDDRGPDFTDFKVFDRSIPLDTNTTVQDRLTWASDCGHGCLFDVDADPTEHVDLAARGDMREILTSMTAELKTLNEGVFSPSRGQPSVTACTVAASTGGFYGPFVDAIDKYSPAPAQTPVEVAKNKMLTAALSLLNHEKVLDATAAAAQLLIPLARNQLVAGLDKCLTPRLPTVGANATELLIV